MRITVYHDKNPNGDHTEFDATEYRVQDNGGLLIVNWITTRQSGNAYFAAGKWSYVCAITKEDKSS